MENEEVAESNEVALQDIVRIIRSRIALIIAVTLTCGALAALVAFMLPPQYEADLLLASVSEDGDAGKLGSVSSLVSQYGGLSALGGFNFSTSSRKAEAIATLQSRGLTRTYIQEKNLLPVLFHDRWDSSKNKWKSDDPTKIPSLWQAEEYFRGNVRKITEDKKTGLVTLTIIWSDPVMAATWANDLVSRTNQYLRQAASEQSNRNIAYLNDQLARTSVVELQRAIYGLIESEIKKVMVAQGSDEYAFKVLDPAVPPEHKSRPKRGMIIVFGLLAGLVLSLLISLLLGNRNTRK